MRASGTLDLSIGPELADAVKVAVAEVLADWSPATPGPWLNVKQATEYLACKKDRIYDLKRQGRLRYAKDGSRLLFRREWLEEVVEIQEPEAE
jgi:excisionase family DNA binding protein